MYIIQIKNDLNMILKEPGYISEQYLLLILSEKSTRRL